MEEHSGRRLLRQFSTSTKELLRFWQTTSHDVIAPADCICKVISRKKGNELYLRDSQRFVPHRRLYLRVFGNRSSSNRSTDNPELPIARKVEGSAESLDEKEPEIEVDLRIEGTAQDNLGRASVQSPRKSGQIKKWLTHEICSWRFGKPENSMNVSEESSRPKMSWATSSCTSWDRDPEPSSAIHAWSTCRRGWPSVLLNLMTFQALIVPCYFARVNRSRGKKHGETQWQQNHWKAMNARRGAWTHDKAQ